MARPSPEEAPVTMATFSTKRDIRIEFEILPVLLNCGRMTAYRPELEIVLDRRRMCLIGLPIVCVCVGVPYLISGRKVE